MFESETPQEPASKPVQWLHVSAGAQGATSRPAVTSLLVYLEWYRRVDSCQG